MRKEEESIVTINGVGDKFWKNREGSLHRIGGPAIEKIDGTKEWYENDKRHRIDGPAIDSSDGIKLFYLRGIYFRRKEEFFEALTDEEKSIAIFSGAFYNA